MAEPSLTKVCPALPMSPHCPPSPGLSREVRSPSAGAWRSRLWAARCGGAEAQQTGPLGHRRRIVDNGHRRQLFGSGQGEGRRLESSRHLPVLQLQVYTSLERRQVRLDGPSESEPRMVPTGPALGVGSTVLWAWAWGDLPPHPAWGGGRACDKVQGGRGNHRSRFTWDSLGLV